MAICLPTSLKSACWAQAVHDAAATATAVATLPNGMLIMDRVAGKIEEVAEARIYWRIVDA
jgi:hypothetical protein